MGVRRADDGIPPSPLARAASAAVRAAPVLGGVALGIGAGVTLERVAMLAETGRPDPEGAERFGELHGRVTPVTSADGTVLHVDELGDGPTLLFAHGFSLSGDAWHYQRRDLPGMGFRCVFLDHRGHGRSGRAPGGAAGDYSLDAIAGDLGAVLDQVAGPGGVVVVAHSMSGFAALTMASRSGLRAHGVAGLVLVDTAYSDTLRGLAAAATARGARRAQLAVLAPAYRVVGQRTRLAHLLRRRGSDFGYLGTRLFGFGPQPSPRQVAFTDRLLAGTSFEVWASVFPGLLDFDLGDALDRLDVPTLVVSGDTDRVIPADAARRMAARIADAELLLLPAAGHMAFMEEHERFNAAVARFAAACLTGAVEGGAATAADPGGRA
jgi:pimeloyl-ACP methyl ester carboxylesterase